MITLTLYLFWIELSYILLGLAPIALYLDGYLQNSNSIPHEIMSLNTNFMSKPEDAWRAVKSTAPTALLTGKKSQKICKPNALNLTAKYIAGLVEAEGTFYLGFLRTSKHKVIIQFSIALVDMDIIESIQGFFGAGDIRYETNFTEFSVTTQWECYYVIKPFFEQHVLLGTKRRSFEIWAYVLEIHINTVLIKSPITRNETKAKIAWLAEKQNPLGCYARKRKESLATDLLALGYSNLEIPIELIFFNLKHILLTSYVPLVNPDPNYVTGFANGDGGSYVSITLKRIQLAFTLGQSQRALLEMFANYFKTGKIYLIDLSNFNSVSAPHFRFIVTSPNDLLNFIFPHFIKYPLFGNSKKNLDAVMKSVDDIKKGNHLNPVLRNQMVTTVHCVNSGGKHRDIALEDRLIKILPVI